MCFSKDIRYQFILAHSLNCETQWKPFLCIKGFAYKTSGCGTVTPTLHPLHTKPTTYIYSNDAWAFIIINIWFLCLPGHTITCPYISTLYESFKNHKDLSLLYLRLKTNKTQVCDCGLLNFKYMGILATFK